MVSQCQSMRSNSFQYSGTPTLSACAPIGLCVCKIKGYSALRQESPCTPSTELPYSVSHERSNFYVHVFREWWLSCMTSVEAQPYIAGKALSSAFHRCTGRWVNSGCTDSPVRIFARQMTNPESMTGRVTVTFRKSPRRSNYEHRFLPS